MDDLRAVDREFCLLPHGGLGAGTAFLEMAGEFANSIDELAWFVLLILFTLETYALSGKAWKGWMSQAVACRLGRDMAREQIRHVDEKIIALREVRSILVDFAAQCEREGLDEPCSLNFN